MKAAEPTAAASAVLDQYAAHVAAIQGDGNAGLQALLRRIDRGEPPLDLDAEVPARPSPRPRRARASIVLASIGVACAAAVAVAWLGGQVGLSSAPSDRSDPQAVYQTEAPSDAASVELRDPPRPPSPSPRVVAPGPAEAVREAIDLPVVPRAVVPTVAPKAKAVARPRAPETESTGSPPDPLVEVRGLARARAALRDGDAASALRLLDEHRRDYPRSAYDEERELLVIAALCDAGRSADARAAGAKFRRAHPGSPLTAHLSGCANESP